MPSIRSQKAQQLVEQDGRLLLAIKAIENGKYTSIRAAAEAFHCAAINVTRSDEGP
jgi:hypothetical protein